jgi:GGDEF domain-containing protein
MADGRVALRIAKHVFALAVKNGAPFTLCTITVENFAELAQIQGRPKATQVVRETADILERGLRPEDVLTHLGEGQFMLGLYGLTGEAAAKRCESLNSRLGELFEGGQIRCTLSLAGYPQDGTNLKQLLVKVGASLG